MSFEGTHPREPHDSLDRHLRVGLDRPNRVGGDDDAVVAVERQDEVGGHTVGTTSGPGIGGGGGGSHSPGNVEGWTLKINFLANIVFVLLFFLP